MIKIIVAIDRRGGIGRGGDMLFHLRADLRRFKALTMGCAVIMGRRTFESLPGGALPGRRNIVVSRNRRYSAPDIELASSLEEAIKIAGDDTDIYIIGGAQIYEQALPVAQALEITVIDAEGEGADTFLPIVPLESFRIATIEDAGTEPPARFYTLLRVEHEI